MWWTVHLDGGPRRVNHAAVAINGFIYSFGGYCSSSNNNNEHTKEIDIFFLDTNTHRWYRSHHHRYTIAYDDGEESTSEQEEHPLRTVSRANLQAKSHVPFQRYGHTVVAHDGKAYLWGGRSEKYDSNANLHEYNPMTKEWRLMKMEGKVPSARDGHTAVVHGSRMYIFGGFEYNHRLYSNDVYAYDFERSCWEHLVVTGEAPSHRDFHASCVLDDKMYVFGGRSDNVDDPYETADTYCEKLYALDLKRLVWSKIDVQGIRPSGRRSHSMWAHGGKLYLFGGYNEAKDAHFNDLFSFDPTTNQWTRLMAEGKQPTPRRRQCSIPVENRVFIFGGTTPNKQKRNLADLADLYVLDYAASLKTLAARALVERVKAKQVPFLGRHLGSFLNNMARPNTISESERAAA